MKKILIILAVAVTLAISSFGQRAREITLDDLIPKGQQESMGIHKLTAEEREALRQHILALLTAACAHANRGTELPEGSMPSLAQPIVPQRGASTGGYAAMGGGHWVKKNIDSGQFIILEDGSLWQVDPLDKIDASLWLPISNITVIESSNGSPGYDCLLINTDDSEKAHAKYLGKK